MVRCILYTFFFVFAYHISLSQDSTSFKSYKARFDNGEEILINVNEYHPHGHSKFAYALIFGDLRFSRTVSGPIAIEPIFSFFPERGKSYFDFKLFFSPISGADWEGDGDKPYTFKRVETEVVGRYAFFDRIGRKKLKLSFHERPSYDGTVNVYTINTRWPISRQLLFRNGLYIQQMSLVDNYTHNSVIVNGSDGRQVVDYRGFRSVTLFGGFSFISKMYVDCNTEEYGQYVGHKIFEFYVDFLVAPITETYGRVSEATDDGSYSNSYEGAIENLQLPISRFGGRVGILKRYTHAKSERLGIIFGPEAGYYPAPRGYEVEVGFKFGFCFL